MCLVTFRSVVPVRDMLFPQMPFLSYLFTIVPLFWTQSGYGLKPPPQLSTERTQSQRSEALKRHFSRTLTIYGPLVRIFPITIMFDFNCISMQTVVNLAEQHGKEGAITSAFRESMSELGSSDVQ